ncbi:5'-nucleotidase, lipoprotein e(P4) family [Chitinophaga deserti]|uniref:5'-nucleotidase, lipoprotein e(P4) family n=1 Tax=Chitinophaga deserti TaxID=2164099 RepID=UPI000D6CC530|nr:5'-nucleotidase, lipoprotein e(P4) family [Chitinophaga deserti]
MRYVCFFLLIIVSACKTAGPAATGVSSAQQNTLSAGPAWAALWQQRAGEYKALCLQAYRSAGARVEEMRHQQTLRPRAIVTDIDETILDNSPYSAATALAGKTWSQASWEEWTGKAAAEPVPGALAFFKFAAESGFTIYYITNRLESERAATLKNLQRCGFPQADNDHLLMSAGNSDKEPRRKEVAMKFEIAMLVGDNLNDFSDIFYKLPAEVRNAKVEEIEQGLGSKYIMIPNAMYGDWLSALIPKGARPDSALRSAIRVN